MFTFVLPFPTGVAINLLFNNGTIAIPALSFTIYLIESHDLTSTTGRKKGTIRVWLHTLGSVKDSTARLTRLESFSFFRYKESRVSPQLRTRDSLRNRAYDKTQTFKYNLTMSLWLPHFKYFSTNNIAQ